MPISEPRFETEPCWKIRIVRACAFVSHARARSPLSDFAQAKLGPSANALLCEVGGREVALFSSGLGDGIYDGYWGLDGQGALCAFAIDFYLLTMPETVDVEIPWPHARGSVKHEALSAHGVELRVPWLDSTRLELTGNGTHHAFMRWRSMDGRFSRVPAQREGKGYRVTPGTPPPGATLYLRIVVGDRPMTVSG